MATKTVDRREVIISVTEAEMNNLLGSKAQEAGLIDFAPSTIEVVRTGDGFEVYFFNDLQVTA